MAEPKPFDRDAYARDVGFADWAEREAAIRRQREAWAKAAAWRQQRYGTTEAAE